MNFAESSRRGCYWMTPNMPLAAFVAAGKHLEYDHTELSRADRRTIYFVFRDDARKGEQLETEFESGKALVPARAHYEWVKKLRREMRDVENGNGYVQRLR